jgi:hypothetical protein
MTRVGIHWMGSATALGAALALTLGQTAAAAPRVVADAQHFSIPAGEGCDFPITLDGSAGNLRMITLRAKKGDISRIIEVRTGVVLTYTRILPDGTAGESISFKTSGSVSQTVTDARGIQTVTATGHNGLVLFSTDIPPTSATQYTGKLVYTVNPATGVFQLLSSANAGTDVCAALA